MEEEKNPLNGPVLDSYVAISRHKSDWTTGTHLYHSVIENKFDEYSSLRPKNHPRKGEIVEGIFRQLSAKFVAKKKGGGWIILNEKESRTKISQRFWDIQRKLNKKAAAEEAAKLKEAAEREAAEEEGARIAAEEEIDAIREAVDAQLPPPNNMAATTIGVHEASNESHERLSPMLFFLADPNPTSTTGSISLAQEHESPPNLMGVILSPTIGDSFSQGHEWTPNPTSDVLSLLSPGSSLATDDPMDDISLGLDGLNHQDIDYYVDLPDWVSILENACAV